MNKAIVTSKGQVTLPRQVREQLGIQSGDKLLFEVTADGFQVRVVRGQDIGALFAALPGTLDYSSEEAEREAVRRGFEGEP